MGGGIAPPQKIFEFFSLKVVYSNAFYMQNAFGSAMLFDKPEDVQYHFGGAWARFGEVGLSPLAL